MTAPKSIAVNCSACGQVAAEVEGTYSIHRDAGEVTEYLLLKCTECSSPFLASRDGAHYGGPSGNMARRRSYTPRSAHSMRRYQNRLRRATARPRNVRHSAVSPRARSCVAGLSKGSARTTRFKRAT